MCAACYQLMRIKGSICICLVISSGALVAESCDKLEGVVAIRKWYKDIHMGLNVQNRSVNLFFLIK